MAFTKEQILEIQAKLASRGYKDTDFDEVTALDGNETIALVKDNKNVRTSVTILLSALSDIGEYYEFGGVVDPEDNPGLLGQKLFFLAYEAGSAVYTNYGGIVVSGELAAITYDPVTGWSKQTIFGIDAYPRSGSDNVVVSDGIYQALAGKQNRLIQGPGIKLVNNDDNTTTISSTGTTPGGIDIDTNPTKDSPNAVSSGGVWSALQTKANDNNVVHRTYNESVAGTKTFTNGIVTKVLSVNDDTSIGGKLSVVGNTILSGTLDITGRTSASTIVASSSVSANEFIEGGTSLVNKYMGINAAYTKAQSDDRFSKKLKAGSGITITDPDPVDANKILISATGGGGGAEYEAGDGISISTSQSTGNEVISSTVWVNGLMDVGVGQPDWVINERSAVLAGSSHPSNKGITGMYAVAEGDMTSATGNYSHVEGFGGWAQGLASHAEGGNGVLPGGSAQGTASHAEGIWTYAHGVASHTQGRSTQANGDYSHASGQVVNTTNTWEHAFGRANQSILGTAGNNYMDGSAFTIGIGTVSADGYGADSRKNMFLGMNNGDIYIYGIGNYDGTNHTAAQTLQYVVNNGGGGASGNYVTLATEQTSSTSSPISGKKEFTGDVIVHANDFIMKDDHTYSYTDPTTQETNYYNGGSVVFDVATPIPNSNDPYRLYIGSRAVPANFCTGDPVYGYDAVNLNYLNDAIDDVTNGYQVALTPGNHIRTYSRSGVNYIDTKNVVATDTDNDIYGTNYFYNPIVLIDEHAQSDETVPNISLKASGGYIIPTGDSGTSTALARFRTNDPIQSPDVVNLGYLQNNYPSNSSVTNLVNTSVTNVLQSKLVAGTGIRIDNNVPSSGYTTISATGGSGGSGDIYTEIYYTDLVELREAGELVPGMKYRIIDYVTRVDNTNGMGSESARLNSMRSIEQQFDIVVTALSNTQLSEEACAVPHEFDTEFELYWYGFTLPLIEMTTVTFTDEQTFDVYRFYFKHDHNKEIWVTTDFKCFPVFMSPSEYTMMGDHAAQAQIAGTEFTLKNGVAYNTSGDTQAFKVRNSHYFDSCNLSAWKIWYTLDNNVERYTWSNYAVPRYMYHDNNGTQVELEFQKQVTSANGTRYYLYGTADQVASLVPAGSDALYLAAVPTEDSVQRPFPYSGEAVLYCLDSDYTICENDTISTYVPSGTATDNPTKYVGNGVIYRMIDEWGNDCPYDFKNIQYHRRLNSYGLPIGSNGTWYYVFTFNMYSTYDHSTYDASIVQNTQYGDAVTGDTFTRRTYDNVLKPCSVGYVTGTSDNTYGDKFVLNQIIFYGSGNTSGSIIDASGSSNNEFGYDCFNITFGNYAYGNKFGERCSHIVLGFKNYDNIFSNECTDIMTVSGVVEYYNTSDTNHISGCKFGTGCSDIKFTGTTRENVTVGQGCKTLEFNSLMRNVTIGGRCMYLAIGVSTSASADRDYVQNVCIASGTHGTNSTTGMLTIGVTNVNADYEVKIGQTSGGALREYCEANLATV